MRPLFLKEIREQFKLPIIAAILFIGILRMGFTDSRQALEQIASLSVYRDFTNAHPLLSTSLLQQSSYLCGIFGLVLGWLQIRSEKHPDLWAFLIHRPTTRGSVLRSKLFSGLVLYLLGTGLPALGFILICSRPGAIAAPFEWSMALPIIAIVLSGIMHYFAGLLTALRQARWYASRGVGIVLTVVATAGILRADEFWQALLIIALVSLLLAIAVWGHFQTRGYYCGQGSVPKCAFTLLTTFAAMIAIGIGLSFLGSILGRQDEYHSGQYVTTKEGRILKVVHTPSEDPEVIDVDPATAKDYGVATRIKQRQLQSLIPTVLGANTDPEQGSTTRLDLRESYSSLRRYVHPWRTHNKTLWYLGAEGKLVAFHALTREPVAQLAPPPTSIGGRQVNSGFLRSTRYTHYNFEEYSGLEILPTSRVAYIVDLDQQALRPVLTLGSDAKDEDSFVSYASHGALPNREMLLLSRSVIRLLNNEGRETLHLKRSLSPDAYPSATLNWMEITNSYIVRFDPNITRNKKSGDPLTTHFEWRNTDGTDQKAVDLPQIAVSRTESFLDKAVFVFMPPLIPFEIESPEGPVSQGTRPFQILVALLCAGCGIQLGRRYQFSTKHQITWTLFHLAAGVPGFVTFLAVQEWPHKEKCEHCKKSRVVNRDQCEHCSKPFPAPEKNGLEIFEPLTTLSI